MTKDVRGKNVVFSVFVIDTWYPMLCAKSGAFDTEQDEIEVTSINSGSDKEFIPGMRSSTLSLNGVTRIDNTDGTVSVFYLMQQARSVLPMRASLTNNGGTNIALTFNGMISHTGFTKDGISQSSLRVRISGAITHGTIVTPPVPATEFSIYINAVAGQSSVSSASLDGVTVLAVARSGFIHNSTSGTPGNMQFKYTDGAGTGTISFDTTNPFAAGEVIYVLYRV